MKLRHLLSALVISAGAQLASEAAHFALAQTPTLPDATKPRPSAGPPPSYKVDSVLVSVDALVTDDSGRVLTGLRQGNFRVFDDGIPQEILHFSPASEPITIVVLMEYSAASSSYFAGKAANWGTRFLSHLNPDDWVALTTFDLKPKVRVDFTHSQYEVRDAIGNLRFPNFSQVNLYDALIDTLDKLEAVRGRTSILLLATGANTFSASTFDEVRERLKRTGTVMFCVGLAEAEYVRYGGDSAYLQEKNALTAFARQTGGIALFPRFEGELPDIFRTVVDYLRGEYTLSFRPSGDRHDGKFHRLKVEIVGPDGGPLKVRDEKGRQHRTKIHAREGYTALKDE